MQEQTCLMKHISESAMSTSELPLAFIASEFKRAKISDYGAQFGIGFIFRLVIFLASKGKPAC